MSRAIILYIAAAINLLAGVMILWGFHDEFVSGETSVLSYVLRGVGPLTLAAAFLFLARQTMAKEGSDDA